MLSQVMEKTRAWERLNDPEYCSRLNVVGLRVLMIEAGYEPDAVQRAINDHGMSRLNAGMVQ